MVTNRWRPATAVAVLRRSSVPYLATLTLTLLLASWANYLAPLAVDGSVSIRGQSLGIALPLTGFPLLVGLWLAYRGGNARSRWLAIVLGGLALAWVIQLAITRSHGDQVSHLVWLFVPILAMVWWKPPSVPETWVVLVAFGWGVVAIIVATRALEALGLVPMFSIPQEVLDWERGRYWLPISSLFGLDSRWPGPFGYNSKTAFMGAVLVIIGAARWRWHSWVFVSVGLLAILLASARASTVAMLAGLAVLVIFSRRGLIARVPVPIRVGAALGLVVLAGLAVSLNRLGSTGRLGDSGIWSKFLDVWATSPWLGVGQVGILSDSRTGPIMEAHNALLQQLTRFGVVGFLALYTVMAIAVALMAVAAYRGLAWPLALTVAYYTASVTEVFQDGLLQHTPYSVLLLLCVLGAAAYLTPSHPRLNAVSTSANGEAPTVLMAPPPIKP